MNGFETFALGGFLRHPYPDQKAATFFMHRGFLWGGEAFRNFGMDASNFVFFDYGPSDSMAGIFSLAACFFRIFAT